ncbi:MAG: HEAT repeat domain-containing protein [Phycisphaerae bacterium]
MLKEVHATVPWQGRDYPAADGINVLMEVIANPATDPLVRANALGKLGRLASWLPNTNRIPELIALYDTLRERGEKGELLLTLMYSDDPRTLPLFVKVLDKEQDNTLRLLAAHGLAKWNVRRGVVELLPLFECTEPLGLRTVRDGVAGTFRGLNRRKGWGCPEEEIGKSMESRPDLDEDQRRGLYIAEVKKWFEENKHRFPDWKPGDPLPKVPAPDTKKSTGE